MKGTEQTQSKRDSRHSATLMIISGGKRTLFKTLLKAKSSCLHKLCCKKDARKVCISMYNFTFSFPNRNIALSSYICERIKLYGMCGIILENISVFYYTNLVDLSLAQVSDEIHFLRWFNWRSSVFLCFSVFK